jgi:hypothetical protein
VVAVGGGVVGCGAVVGAAVIIGGAVAPDGAVATGETVAPPVDVGTDTGVPLGNGVMLPATRVVVGICGVPVWPPIAVLVLDACPVLAGGIGVLTTGGIYGWGATINWVGVGGS